MDRRSSHEGRSNFSVEEICSAMGAGVPVYFCDAYCPWQRGSNENTNGLLRQYFPKTACTRPSVSRCLPVRA
jgi:IS30 family transposase